MRRLHKFLTLRMVVSAIFVSTFFMVFSCKKDRDQTIHGVWKLEKYSCDQFSNYRAITFFFDTAAAHSDSAWYIDPLVQKDTVFVKYTLNGNSIVISDAKNGWNGTFSFKFNNAKSIQITRTGDKCGDERYTFYK